MNAPDYISDTLLWIAGVIHSHGIAVITAGSGECSDPDCDCEPEVVTWSYTIGFADRGHPEVVTFGLPPDDATSLMNWIRHREVQGRPIRPGAVLLVDGRWLRFDPVPTEWTVSEEWPMGVWFGHYEVGRDELKPPTVMQLVWADREGRFPEDPGCEPTCALSQPVGEQLLGEWATRLP